MSLLSRNLALKFARSTPLARQVAPLVQCQRFKSTQAVHLKAPQEFVSPPEVAKAPQAAEEAKKPAKKTYPLAQLSNEELVSEVQSGAIKFHALENALGDLQRAVEVRRAVLKTKMGRDFEELPYQHYNWEAVHGQCCENVIGYTPLPVGVAGPLLLDGQEYYVPMATTEGALVASTARGAKAISMSGGANSEVIADSMSRAPVLQAPNVHTAAQVKKFCQTNFDELEAAFNSTTRFGKLQSVNVHLAGRKMFVRFTATSGDAMGMNMVGKGVDKALSVLLEKFPVDVLALSGNMCTDKKPSAVNWVQGRGKSVVVDAVISKEIVTNMLHTTVDALVETNISKNLIGSAMAGSIGGFNAHAANVVAATFLATGQDPAQVVESSQCMTLMEREGDDLYMSVTLPCLEVGTIGGGTILPGQKSMLAMLGVNGSNNENPGGNSSQLARIIAGTVMAGELSLMSALTSGHLISSHMKLNRK